MFRYFFKHALTLLHPLATRLYATHKTNVPFLCIITPTFDQALPSLKALMDDIKAQTFPDYIHVIVSNGPSPLTKKYVAKMGKHDPRFIYRELKKEPQSTWQQLQVNLGKRKNYALKHYDAERYVFIDADSSIIDRHFIAKLYLAHHYLKKDILVARINHKNQTLPQFPVRSGTIDMCNFTISRRLAKSSHYPTDPWQYFFATDFLFFREINTEDNTTFLPFTYLKKDARRSYQSVGEKIRASLNR